MIVPRPLLIALSIVLVLLLAGAGYGFLSLTRSHESEIAAIQAESTRRAAEYETLLTQKTDEAQALTRTLAAEKAKNGSFESTINGIKSTVDTLEKLKNTDPELLKKYSKVYFLNENYVPTALATIPSAFSYPHDRTLEIHAQVAPYLTRLLQAAQKDGIDLRVISAFRSFGTQALLKSGYTVTYGSGANRFSADQGYSEHQLGTTVDFTTEALGSAFTPFDTTQAYAWLETHADTYGFVLSYPADNLYYQYEPWHWRFVGTELAHDLSQSKKHLYELSEREIDAYLVTLFD